MTLAELRIAFESEFDETGDPTYWYGKADKGTKLPYIVANDNGSDNFEADNIVYKGKQGVYLELYTVQKNEALETRIEELLASLEIPWSKSETKDEDQNFVLMIYQFYR